MRGYRIAVTKTVPPPHIPSEQSSLEASEARYRRLFETAQDAILILDAEEKSGKIMDANPFVIDLLGYSLEELIGKELWEIGLFSDKDESKAAMEELQRVGYIRYEDMPLETKQGKRVEVEFVSNSYMVGELKVIQCNIRDITDRKWAERAVRISGDLPEARLLNSHKPMRAIPRATNRTNRRFTVKQMMEMHPKMMAHMQSHMKGGSMSSCPMMSGTTKPSASPAAPHKH